MTSSRTRDQTRVSYISMWILDHWATRGAPAVIFWSWNLLLFILATVSGYGVCGLFPWRAGWPHTTMTYSFPSLEPVSCPKSSSVASWPAYLLRFLRRQIRWSGIPISLRIVRFVVIHRVKGFSVVNEADVFLEFSGFLNSTLKSRDIYFADKGPYS